MRQTNVKNKLAHILCAILCVTLICGAIFITSCNTEDPADTGEEGTNGETLEI